MRHLLIILLLSFFQYSVKAQKMPTDYFEEGGKFYENKEYDKALSAYQFIIDNHRKNELYPRAFYNIGYIYFNQKEFEKAILIFRTILNWNFDEREKLGGDIMADPYTNYKHRASKILSDIYYEITMYDSALHYFSLSDTANPYLHFCGNEYAANDVHTALKYSSIYQKLQQPDKAINKLLPAVFITLADNSMVIDELRTLLKSQSNLKARLDKSLDSIYRKDFKGKSYAYSRYYFNFLGTEIAVPESFDDDKSKFDKRDAIKEIKSTDFYKMIESL